MLLYRDTNYSSNFVEPENEVLTYSASVSPALSKFDHPSNSSARFTILNTNNSDIGTYEITITATDGHPDTMSASFTINFTILEDLGWEINSALANRTVVAHTNITYSLTDPTAYTFKDEQNDYISRTGYDISPTQSFMTINAGLDELTLNNPGTADVGNYTVSIYWKDNHTDTGFANMTFTVEITENVACRIDQQMSGLGYYAHRNVTLHYGPFSLFDDPENDTIALSGYSIVPNASFITQMNSGFEDYNLSNPLNADVGNYTFSIFCDDNYVSRISFNYLYRLILLLYHKVSILR